MWWYLFFCVIYTKTIGVFSTNTTGSVTGSKYKNNNMNLILKSFGK